MTEQSIAHSPCHKFHYAVQSPAQRRGGGGKGQSERSWRKHDLIEKMINRQAPVLTKKGRGCIIDMHAGDGKETPHPQPDFFNGGSLKTTAALAVVAGRRWNADVILCERSRNSRKILETAFAQYALVIGHHAQLLDREPELTGYSWLIVINDPNGYANHGVEVMARIAALNPISDFIINFNRRSLTRPLGLTNPDHPRASVRGSWRSGMKHKWMLSPDEWRKQLGKRHVLATTPVTLSRAMESQILLVSNFIAGYGK